MPLLAVLLGSVWKLVNPIRSLHWALSRAMVTLAFSGAAALSGRAAD